MKYSRITKNVHEIEDAVLTASEKETARLAFDFEQRWLVIFLLIILISIICLAGRVFYLGVMRGDYYSFVASGNSVRSVPIIAPRGSILDKDGKILADNMPSRSIIVLPKQLPESVEGVERIIDDLANMLGTDHVQIETIIHSSQESKEIMTISENISHETALSFRAVENNFPGIQIQQTAIRNYYNGEHFSHIIGYEGLIKRDELEENPEYLLTDRIGKTGLELYYEKYLHGSHGYENALVDSRGNVVKDLVDTKPVYGHTLHTHIDADLQDYLVQRLLKELERAETKRASAIVIDPRDGAVRSLVSLPSYDNNIFAQGIDSETYSRWITDENRPLFNRAIAGAYAPGSTVKPVMGVATLEEGIVSPEHQIESRGGLQLGAFFFGDWRAHGFTDLRRAIAVSSDVYFYTIGGGYGDIVGLGIERMKEYMTRFGYGEETGIDLPGEVSGVYPNKEWKEEKIGERWYVGNTYHASIGQGYITATALQVANSIAAIVNGGILYEPHIVGRIVNDETGKEIVINPKMIRDNVGTSADLKVITQGMRQTVTGGTATMLNPLDVEIAGKTGTAQFGGGDEVHSWFVSYAPYENPEMIIVIMVEGQTGDISSATVPVAHDVYKWHFGGREEVTDEENLEQAQEEEISEE